MVNSKVAKKVFLFSLAIHLVLFAVLVPVALAAGEDQAAEKTQTSLGEAIRVAGLALGAGLVLAVAAYATSKVQAAVCAGGVGVIGEKKETFPLILILVTFPETMVLFGFVMAIILAGKI